MSNTVDVTGSCNCGAVTYEAAGDVIFNLLCHCKPCSRSRGVSPTHVIGVADDDFKVTLGQDNIKEVQPNTGKMTHAFCTKCGCHIFQKPSHVNFRGLLPVTFKIENNEDDTGRIKLPESMQPTVHVNYESRLLDYNDTLPKFLKFPSGPRVNNDGSPYTE